MKTETLKRDTIIDYLGYALYAFGGLGLEIPLTVFEINLWGTSSNQWTLLQNMIHWTVTCIVWGIFVVVLAKHISKQNKKISLSSIITTIILMIISVTYTSFVWNGFKPAIEYASIGLTKFILQYLYYAFESMLIVLIIEYGQMAFEKVFKKEVTLPLGGIFLAITWGLIHIPTQGFATGVYTVVQSLLFGLIYLALNKNIKVSYVVITFVFMI